MSGVGYTTYTLENNCMIQGKTGYNNNSFVLVLTSPSIGRFSSN